MPKETEERPLPLRRKLYHFLVKLISETNGITLMDTLELAVNEPALPQGLVRKALQEFRKLLFGLQQNEVDINTLLKHPVSAALFDFFKNFPLPFREEHIHLTGSLHADFVWSELEPLLQGKGASSYREKVKSIYSSNDWPLRDASHLDELLRLKEGELFERYLQILTIPKFILTSRNAHERAAYHMAERLYHNYNVGHIRLKFTLSRASTRESDQIPGVGHLSEKDVVLGLYQGFESFRKKVPRFSYVLSPCFRKEADFYDGVRFKSKEDHFLHQVDQLLDLLDEYPEIQDRLTDIDTVGDEKELYRKTHFYPMQLGLRKLEFRGLSLRSHHGETWHTLRKGIQAVDNALNTWHINTLEHGLSLGINPNLYFQMLYQRVMAKNAREEKLSRQSRDYKEIQDIQFRGNKTIQTKLLKGEQLSAREHRQFIKTKFHTAREIEHYQHDILNLMLRKKVSVVSLPSSNNRLTGLFPEFKDHPFSWWEKKGIELAIGTDNDITLNTNYIKELLILLYTDADSLKITKLLKVATGEQRRPYLSHMLWKMREQLVATDENPYA